MPTAAVFLALFVSGATGAPGAAPFSGMISLRLGGQVVEGQPLAWGAKEVRLLARDGRLWQFAPGEATDWRQLSHRFSPATIGELRADLLRELGRDFEVTTTTHYVVAHGRGQRDRWAERFEGLYREFVSYFGKRGFQLREPEFPLVGIVLRDEAEFRRYMASRGEPVPAGLIGLYSLTTNRILVYDMDPGGKYDGWHETATTILHEATHQTAFNTGIHSRYAPPPLWVVEGLATLFEAPGVYDARHRTTRADRINQGRLDDFRQAVRPRHTPDLITAIVAEDTLFRTHPGIAYAEAWALTFYLIETQPANYARYVALTAARPPFTDYTAADRVADFTSVFGENWAMLEAQLLRFTAGLPATGR
ncbi:MAG: DUF1570 domain-containing protein [Patescibacteria group bacterium]|nr:DUF1570 domain-containing protein [Patescibacteria group bacterium]